MERSIRCAKKRTFIILSFLFEEYKPLRKNRSKQGKNRTFPLKNFMKIICDRLFPNGMKNHNFKDRTEKIRRNSSADFFSYTMPESRSSSSHRFSAAYGTKRFRFDGMRP
ncbi:MAG TPA: hypothetical protein DC013_10230 [Ruminococcaceae bacterium]|nr:hypothetical protein [Oscillospiraceae bacterium]